MRRRKWRQSNMIEVENAILMAAGMSTRMAPLSYEIPKALLKIEGEVLIERQILQLRESGIRDITIVVGYKKEQFTYLKEKFEVKLIENPYYMERNNHSSLFVARKELKNTYISCGDYYFAQNPFRRKEEVPYYGLTYQEGETPEWCVETDESGKIQKVVIGGKDAWVMQGEVLFDRTFSRQLIPLLESAMEREEERQTYWEDLYVSSLGTMDLYGKQKKKGEVLEFDSLDELRETFPWYRAAKDSRIFQKLLATLNCEEGELTGFVPLKENGVAKGVTFSLREQAYRYFYESGKLERCRI